MASAVLVHGPIPRTPSATARKRAVDSAIRLPPESFSSPRTVPAQPGRPRRPRTASARRRSTPRRCHSSSPSRMSVRAEGPRRTSSVPGARWPWRATRSRQDCWASALVTRWPSTVGTMTSNTPIARAMRRPRASRSRRRDGRMQTSRRKTPRRRAGRTSSSTRALIHCAPGPWAVLARTPAPATTCSVAGPSGVHMALTAFGLLPVASKRQVGSRPLSARGRIVATRSKGPSIANSRSTGAPTSDHGSGDPLPCPSSRAASQSPRCAPAMAVSRAQR